MSTNNDEQPAIRVINKEYERVLSNPDNIIMSSDLQGLIDMPLPDADIDLGDVTLPNDQFTVTVLDATGMPFGVRGEFIKLSSNEGSYSIAIETTSIKQEFLTCLETSSNEPITILLSGLYEADMLASDVSWTIEKSAPYDYHLNIKFRSENVIF